MKTASLFLCAPGVSLPYWQFAPWPVEHGLDRPLFFLQLFGNRVGAFSGMDVFVSAVALLVFAGSEGRRAGARAAWPVALAVLAVGVSLGLPLFLYLRERRLERVGARRAGREAFLVPRAQSGDREALDTLLKSVQEPLYRYVFSLVGERHPAEDALRETFVRVYRKLGWLREPELFRPWAYRTATREAFRQLKRERRWAQQVRDEEALARVERGERDFKLAFFGGVAFEALFLFVLLLAADLSNRTHVLLLIATVGGYTVVALGLVALGAHFSRGVARVLKAVELLGK